MIVTCLVPGIIECKVQEHTQNWYYETLMYRYTYNQYKLYSITISVCLYSTIVSCIVLVTSDVILLVIQSYLHIVSAHRTCTSYYMLQINLASSLTSEEY